MVKPAVSIITPSFNQGRFIEETIQSVLSQDYPNIEYIVIDGGSTDETLDILRKYDDDLHWISEPDEGQSDAINKGFQLARGEVVAWLNSDDTFLPGAVSKAVNFLVEHPKVMMVYGEGYQIDEQGRVKGRFPATEPFNLWRLIYYSDYILQQTVFMQKQVFEEVGMLDKALHYGMDWDLWIRIGKRHPVAYIPEYLGNLREYGTAKTSAGGLKRFEELVQVMRRHGRRRFPPAYFNYGWDPYQEAILRKLSRNLPWLDWHWLSASGDFLRRLIAYTIFKRVTRLSQPSPYPDGWLSDRAHFLFTDWQNKKQLRLVGSTEAVPAQALPLKITVKVNGTVVQHQKVNRTSEFTLDNLLPAWPGEGALLEVTLITNKSFIPANYGQNDHRRLSFQLKHIALI